MVSLVPLKVSTNTSWSNVKVILPSSREKVKLTNLGGNSSIVVVLDMGSAVMLFIGTPDTS